MRTSTSWGGRLAACGVAALIGLSTTTGQAEPKSSRREAPAASTSIVSSKAAMRIDREASTVAAQGIPLEPTALAASAERTRRIGLAEALQRATEENLDLALARVEEARASARRLVTIGGLTPRLEIGGGIARTNGRVQGSLGQIADVDFDTIDPGIRLAYRVNLGARILEALATDRAADVAEWSTRARRQRLLFEVFELYYDLLLSEAGLRIARRRVEDGEEFVSVVDARRQSGLELESELARAQARLARNRRDLARARALWEGTSARLAGALRLEPDELLVAEEAELRPRNIVEARYDSAEALSRARTAPAVEVRRRASRVADHRADAAWWELAGPELDLWADQTYVGERFGDLEGGTRYGAFVRWTVSLERIGRIAETRADRERARLEAVRTEERAVAETRGLLAQLRAARESLPLARDGLEAAERNRRISRARFRAGTAIALEVLDAEDRLALARLDLSQAVVDLDVTAARLLAATGRIDIDRLTGLP